jgi:hypothetical protein
MQQIKRLQRMLIASMHESEEHGLKCEGELIIIRIK